MNKRFDWKALRKAKRFAVVLVLGALLGATAVPAPTYAAGTHVNVHVSVPHLAEGGSGDGPPGAG